MVCESFYLTPFESISRYPKIFAIWLSRRWCLNVGNPINDGKSPPKRKPPIWPWLVLIALTLGAIYLHHQVSVMIEDLKYLSRDIIQLVEWLLPELPD